MVSKINFDVIIIGGSYAGLSAALSLGRSLREVLIIDNWEACNKKAPYLHNFLTNDGETPATIAFKARRELALYNTVTLLAGTAQSVTQTDHGFNVTTAAAEAFSAKKILFATGLKDIMPKIPGFAECWGNSIIHCPYCHGYELQHEQLAVFGNGDEGYEFAKLISNWSDDITLFTNGASTLNPSQQQKLLEHHINVIETPIAAIECVNNQVQYINLADSTKHSVQAIFTKLPFEQCSPIPRNLGCVITPEGHIQVDEQYAATVPGVYAAGDNSSRLRGVANAVAAGMMAGVFINKALIDLVF